jgi:hypothetical protein
LAKQGKRTPEHIRNFVIGVKANAPGLSHRQIADRVEEKFGEGAKIDKSTIGRILGEGNRQWREQSTPEVIRIEDPQRLPGRGRVVLADWEKEHTKELFYFGQRVRDRLSPYGVKELVQLGKGVQQGELWAGRPDPFQSDQPIDHLEKKVEEEWGAIRYDVREHPLFKDFQEHLAGHPCWPALEQMEVSFQEQRKAWGQAYLRVLNKIKKKLAELKRSDIDAQPIANSLMAYAYEEGKLEFSYERDRSNQRGQDYCYLKLGAFNVGHEEDPEGLKPIEDPERLKPIIDVHRELKEKVLSWKVIETFQKRHADGWGKIKGFQECLGSDAQLRKSLLESRCESCP